MPKYKIRSTTLPGNNLAYNKQRFQLNEKMKDYLINNSIIPFLEEKYQIFISNYMPSELKI